MKRKWRLLHVKTVLPLLFNAFRYICVCFSDIFVLSPPRPPSLVLRDLSNTIFSVDFFKHLNPGIPDGVFPAIGGNNPANITGNTVVRKVFTLHNDSGLAKRLDDSLRFERAF